jgi:tetratricopeptide (TPR) repeat protein
MERKSSRRAVLFFLVLLVPFAVFPDQAGFGPGRETLNRVLSGVAETRHFRIHYDPSRISPEEIRRISDEHEWLWFRLTRVLKTNPSWKADTYLYSDPEVQRRLTGVSGYLFTLPWKHEIHTGYDPQRGIQALDHELVHVLAGDFGLPGLKISVFIGLIEGLAKGIEENYFLGGPFQESPAASEKLGFLSSADTFIGWKGFGRQNAMLSYSAAASFSGYLIQKYGIERFKRVYAWANFSKVYGKTLSALSREWKEYLKTVPVKESTIFKARTASNPKTHPPFYKSRCPRVGQSEPEPDPEAEARELMERGKYSIAATRFLGLFNAGIRKTEYLLSAAFCYGKLTNFTKAESLYSRVLSSNAASVKDRDTAFFGLQNTALAQRNWEEAMNLLQKRIALPIEDSSALKVKLAVLQNESVREQLLEAIEIPSDDLAKFLLRRIILQNQGFCPAMYFYITRSKLERMSTGSYLSEVVAQYLSSCEDNEYRLLKFKILMNLGETGYFDGNLEKAEGYFKNASDLELTPQTKLEAASWLERLKWKKATYF